MACKTFLNIESGKEFEDKVVGLLHRLGVADYDKPYIVRDEIGESGGNSSVRVFITSCGEINHLMTLWKGNEVRRIDVISFPDSLNDLFKKFAS